MAILQCPICRKRHSIQEDYDNQDFICKNCYPMENAWRSLGSSRNSGKKWAQNKFSTLFDETRDVTLINAKEQAKKGDEERVRSSWYNY